jgi:PPOX class probable F420-dependent enzyme
VREMTRDEWRAFAGTGTRTGKLAITRRDGAPHVTPVWFLLDEVDGADHVVFNTGVQSLKGKTLRRDPRLALCVDDQQPPYSYVLLHAEATLSEDPGPLRDWATRIATRYVGPDLGAEYGVRNGSPGEYLVRARITRVIAATGVAD